MGESARTRSPRSRSTGCRSAGTFDLVGALEALLVADCADFRAAPTSGVPDGSIVLGDPTDVIVLGASVEPGVVFDVRHGAVVIDEAVEVRHGTRLEGPVYAGPGTRLLGGFIRSSVFGPECRVRGEIAASVFLGYANKAHDGFVGHSVVGHWVNLGAGTTTSNLKNTYGLVRLEVHGQRIETGRHNLGTLFGDHAKTAIGTMLATGTVVVGRRERLRPADATEVRAAVRLGVHGTTRAHRGRVPRDRRTGDAAPAGSGAHAGAAASRCARTFARGTAG